MLRASGPQRPPSILWAPEFQEKSLLALSTASSPISIDWTQSLPPPSPWTVWNSPVLHHWGSVAPSGFSLGDSCSIFLLPGEEVAVEGQPSSQATAISLTAGTGGWALPPVSALGEREGVEGGEAGREVA